MSALVIGYGNPLRGDDGVGWHAVEGLVRDGAIGDTRALTRHQLTPELAADVAGATAVVFVDARADDGGAVRVDLVVPEAGAPGVPGAWTHHMTPGALVAMAGDLYGHTPRAWLVTVPAASTGASDELSPEIRALLPFVVAAVEDLLQRHSPSTTA
jgi:hydrogenase maturation protease